MEKKTWRSLFRRAAAATVDPAPPDRAQVARTPFADRPRPLVTICAWCYDAAHQTAAARANGFDVSHTICPACAARALAAGGGWEE